MNLFQVSLEKRVALVKKVYLVTKPTVEILCIFFLIKKIISFILGPRGNNGLPGRTGCMFLMSSDLK